MDETPAVPHMPSAKQQSWGALISIVVIVLMIVGGAYYAWRDRAERAEQPPGISAAISL
jgi:NADH:ubiquinone oxidoreductase subunit 3 (subunit A)